MLLKVLLLSLSMGSVTTAWIESTYSNHYRTNSSTNLHMVVADKDTAIQARSYYGASSPAFYPAFDPISILASLAFLAFLLQSFAALFDRSRSIIPAVISSRDFSPDNPPDPIELILRTLDKYEVLNNDIDIDNDKPLRKI